MVQFSQANGLRPDNFSFYVCKRGIFSVKVDIIMQKKAVELPGEPLRMNFIKPSNPPPPLPHLPQVLSTVIITGQKQFVRSSFIINDPVYMECLYSSSFVYLLKPLSFLISSH